MACVAQFRDCPVGVRGVMHHDVRVSFTIGAAIGIGNDQSSQERELLERFGDAYGDYMLRVPRRYIPSWRRGSTSPPAP